MKIWFDLSNSPHINMFAALIRDLQREHLAEYRRVTQQSLDMQRRAVTRQEQIGGLYRRVVAAGALLVVALIVLLVYLLGYLR